MANNRLMLCEVDDDGRTVNGIVIAKNSGGEWFATDYDGATEYVKSLNDFWFDAFVNGHGISLKDEYMHVPLPPLYVYNDPYEGDGRWVFLDENDEPKERTCKGIDVNEELSGTDCPAWMCSECGELFEAGAKYCSQCGAKVIDNA